MKITQKSQISVQSMNSSAILFLGSIANMVGDRPKCEVVPSAILMFGGNGSQNISRTQQLLFVQFSSTNCTFLI